MENNFYNEEDNTVLVGSRIHLLVHKVILLESDINYTHIFLKSGEKHLISYTLKKVANRIQPFAPLFRINRSNIINLNYLKNFDGHHVVLKNRNKLKVSRRRIPLLIKKLEEKKAIV